MEIRALAHTPFEALAAAFATAFATYDVQISATELRTMLRRRGFDAGLSFAAFDGDKIAAFTLNGIGESNGMRTAYDTGTGTLPEYRGQGLASVIFEASLPHLREAGVEHYLLEVLQHNEAAVKVYRNLGFEVSREFNFFKSPPPKIQPSWHKIEPIKWAELPRLTGDFAPSWQNSFEAIERAEEDFIFLVAENGAGYLVFEPASGDITQIVVAKAYRRQGIGSALLGEALRHNRVASVKCINTEIGRDDALAAFLNHHRITFAGKQFEMVKKL